MTSRPAQPIAAPRTGDVPGSVTGPVATNAPAGAPQFSAQLADAVERSWRKAGASADWNLTREEFRAALERSAARRFPGARSDAQEDAKKIEAYLETLYARDLALAVACSNGSAAAWDVFMAEFRPELYRAARAIVGRTAGGDSAARELGDSLYADLYGLRESGGRRKSLLEYFHGRSKLSTWLHAVLARRHVDEIRRARATGPLEDETGEVIAEVATQAVARAASSDGASSPNADPERASYLAALQAALAAVLGALDTRDRLRLAYYYADDRTLAEIGGLLGEHEATVSRKLARTRRDVRSRVETWLRDGKKWSEAQVCACLECANGEWPFDLTAQLRATDADPTDENRAPASVGSNAARKI
jgi:RNA polymerase sigma factor (sigma-70 family)